MTTTEIELTGDVVRPGDAGYEAARLGWNKLYSRYPDAVVFCRDAQDVLNAVKWARRQGIAFRARSGRHSLEGLRHYAPLIAAAVEKRLSALDAGALGGGAAHYRRFIASELTLTGLKRDAPEAWDRVMAALRRA